MKEGKTFRSAATQASIDRDAQDLRRFMAMSASCRQLEMQSPKQAFLECLLSSPPRSSSVALLVEQLEKVKNALWNPAFKASDHERKRAVS